MDTTGQVLDLEKMAAWALDQRRFMNAVIPHDQLDALLAAARHAKELQQVMLEPIACDVLLPPGTRFRKGVSLVTIRAGIEQRRGRETEFQEFATTQERLAAANARIAELEEIGRKLRDDLGKEQTADCERCGAPLYVDDDYVSDPDGTTGCWYAMSDRAPKCERECYAYRVGKPSAALTPAPLAINPA